MLGVIARQSGRAAEAIELISKALSAQPTLAGGWYNLGNAYLDNDEAKNAVASFEKSVMSMPRHVDSRLNLGNALRQTGQMDAALENYRAALHLDTKCFGALLNMGITLVEIDHPQDALPLLERAASIDIANATVHNTLAIAYRAAGRIDAATDSFRHALSLAPDQTSIWAAFANHLETHSPNAYDDTLARNFEKLLDHPTVTPARLARSVIATLVHHPDVKELIARSAPAQTKADFPGTRAADALAAQPLFLKALKSCPLADSRIEQLLTAARRAMLLSHSEDRAQGQRINFLAALSIQCFINEYAYFETSEETQAIPALANLAARAVSDGMSLPMDSIILLGCYRPLSQYPWAEALAKIDLPAPLSEVAQEQIVNPAAEDALKGAIPVLTAVSDAVSQSVRNQYETNPYPRWMRLGANPDHRNMADILKDAPLNLALGDWAAPDRPEILVAGCGTGQHAIATALRFAEAEVTAIDLSLASLAYAERKTREMGIRNIRYAQADILELSGLDQRFDHIESLGVLHHLEDPLKGWKILTNLLRPGGLMKIALYSEFARQDVVYGRSLIANQGYEATPDGIRHCRRAILDRALSGDALAAGICSYTDYYSLSECRDLLFHVQEHRYSLPQIEKALTTLRLEFLCFELTALPGAPGATDGLEVWHDYERRHPETFKGMYQFWCRKPID